MQTYAYGFPRIGKKREYKKIIEGYWNKKITERELWSGIEDLQNVIFANYQRAVDKFPAAEMTLYDSMLDAAIMVGMYEFESLDDYFDLCRGKNALEMTKWFNTNYHYLVPEFSSFNSVRFFVNWNKPKEYMDRYRTGIPFLMGPFTFLKLSKGLPASRFDEYLQQLAGVYREIIRNFPEIHIEEPAFVLDVTPDEVKAIRACYRQMIPAGCKVNLFTYYDSVDFLRELYDLPVAAIGLDLVNGPENFALIEKHGFPEDKVLIAGLVNGRNVWRTNIGRAVDSLRKLSQHAKRIMVSNAGPLYHLPVTIEEEDLDPELLNMLAFAKERLYELNLIARQYEGQKAGDWWQPSTCGANESVKERIRNLKEEDFTKSVPYGTRKDLQRRRLNLPIFPTTTIGSFPQTKEVRKKRADFQKGRISEREYRDFIEKEIATTIHKQEEIGLDVLVHGEFERSDMVEFFAQKLDGLATTTNGWIISYGTRGYRPPIVYGDVFRPYAMTVDEIAYAQRLTEKPVKGMLTGPVTIIAWSYVREDIPVSDVANQIALSLQSEIRDLEDAGIKIVQIDEPAFREKVPIKHRNWRNYFGWAIRAFRLTTNTRPETQIHTHMCYSEFGEIIDQIQQMDFDVISIEAARSKGDIIESFEKVNFDRQIGLGVWDIHSPLVPETGDMKKIVQRALRVISAENFWINPDCGLKTRKWEETIPSLQNLRQVGQYYRRLNSK